MKKILVILTGGTIGSKVEANIINVDHASTYLIIKRYLDKYDSAEKFDVIQPYGILSENISMEHWARLSETISKINYENYAGIIITHGSDTLSYTSAFLGMAFHHLPIPLVIIAANYPLDDVRSNGMDNFRSAVCLIRENYLNGVLTIFRNNKAQNEVFLATRLMESDSYQDQFRSFGGIPFGVVENNHFVIQTNEINPTVEEVNARKEQVFKILDTIKASVQVLRPYPGMIIDNYTISRHTKAILISLYHSGTACVEGEYSILPFLKRCRQNNIDVYIASVKSKNTAKYVTNHLLLESGARPLYNISLEAAYTKLFLWYQNDNQPTLEQAQENIYFEVLPSRKIL